MGTIFHNSHIDLKKWFGLIAIMFSAKKGVSACQAARDLEMRRPTVWSMQKKIIEADSKNHHLMTEAHGIEWRPIAGFDGIYEISSLGEIKNIASGEIKKPQANERGYFHTSLYDKGRNKNVYVHKILLESFIGPAPEGTESCHENGDKSDNTFLNLRYDTSKNNHADRVKHGTDGRGERGPTAKLTEKDVLEIRSLFESLSKIGKRFGVSKHTIADIKSRRTWTHI